jgi:hypothetical protein
MIVVLDTDTKGQLITYKATLMLLQSLNDRFTSAIQSPGSIGLTSQLISKSTALKLKQDETSGDRAGVPFAEADQVKIALTAINGALGELKSLTDFFKTDTKEKGFKLELNKDKLLPEVIHQLKATCPSVALYNSKQVPFSINGQSSPLLQKLEHVYDLRYEAAHSITLISGVQLAYRENITEIGRLETARAATRTAIETAENGLPAAKDDAKRNLERQLTRLRNDAQELKSKQDNLESENSAIVGAFASINAVKPKLQALVAQFDAFASTLFKADDKTPTALLNSLFESERLSALLSDTTSPGYLLEVAPNTVGSTRRIKRNLFLDLFYPTGRVSYNGEATISYSLFNNDGTLRSSCIVKTYLDFKKFKKAYGTTPVFNTCSF